MRIGILANSLPAALKILEEVKSISGAETLVLLCPGSNESPLKTLSKHAARLAFKSWRLKSLLLLLSGKVVIFRKPLEHPSSLMRLEKLELDIGLHKTGVIYRQSVIKAFRLGILNAHIGMLPAFRGRHVMEWSLIQGQVVGITIFFIDAGIDTGGQIVFSEEVDISNFNTTHEAKQHLFALDAVFFRRALELLQSKDLEFGFNDGSGRRYYVMSQLFQSVVQKVIETNH